MTDKPTLQETILLVEDEVLVRMPIAQYLRDCGYKVIEAVNADEAITVLLHKETVVDLVFSDIEMPGAVDGFGLAKRSEEHTSELQSHSDLVCRLLLEKKKKNSKYRWM